MSDLDRAEALHDEAASEYLAASSAYEAAVGSGDPERTKRAFEQLKAAEDSYSHTLRDLVSARQRGERTFEALLRDPTSQVDRFAVVLASIVAHAAALPASAGLSVTVGSAFVE